MADIFLSYAHSDRERARPIVELFQSEGWTVWWDRGIKPGSKWEQELTTQLAQSRALVVLWSRISSKHRWIKREATVGLKKGALVPILLERVAIPKEFRSIQAADLSRWKGEAGLDEVQVLLRRLGELAPPSRMDTVRPGYNVSFLGDRLTIPLPAVSGPAALFRYLHFTIVMNPARRMAHYAAYNVDGTRLFRIPRRRDDWSADPLLPEPLQINKMLLSHSPYDRGTLAPRSSVSWGEEREAWIACRQAFFWTNIAPQHRKLNRWWWLRLENWERKVAIAYERATVFTGPVFSGRDQSFGGDVDLEDGLVAHDSFRVPGAYWKIIAVAAPSGGIAIACYSMDQFEMLNAKLGVNIDIEKYRLSLRHLEKKTRLGFSDLLHRATDLHLP